MFLISLNMSTLTMKRRWRSVVHTLQKTTTVILISAVHLPLPIIILGCLNSVTYLGALPFNGYLSLALLLHLIYYSSFNIFKLWIWICLKKVVVKLRTGKLQRAFLEWVLCQFVKEGRKHCSSCQNVNCQCCLYA